jgi:hypothetical protein
MTYITAIEFLELELSKSNFTNEEIQIIFDKAKFMEKEQIIFAFEIGTLDGEYISAEDYYFQTYENIDHGLNS